MSSMRSLSNLLPRVLQIMMQHHFAGHGIGWNVTYGMEAIWDKR